MTDHIGWGETFRKTWHASPWLVAVGLGMVPILGLSLLGVMVDPRIIMGSPAWLKPAKFAISTSFYCLTVAWLIANVGRPSWALRASGVTIAILLALEVAIIDVQAFRGTTSHFNISTPLNAALFGVMGLSVVGLLVVSVVVAFEMFRARFADRSWGWALRWGMLITVLGSTTGGFMLGPKPDQLEQARTTGVLTTVGKHTVGGPDGGRGLPFTGWSREHGDLRAPHFFGLHAVQVVPLLSWLLFQGLNPRRERTRTFLVMLVSASYAGLIALLTLQALAGRPILSLHAPDAIVFGLWAGLTGVAIVVVVVWDRNEARNRSFLVGV